MLWQCFKNGGCWRMLVTGKRSVFFKKLCSFPEHRPTFVRGMALRSTLNKIFKRTPHNVFLHFTTLFFRRRRSSGASRHLARLATAKPAYALREAASGKLAVSWRKLVKMTAGVCAYLYETQDAERHVRFLYPRVIIVGTEAIITFPWLNFRVI